MRLILRMVAMLGAVVLGLLAIAAVVVFVGFTISDGFSPVYVGLVAVQLTVFGGGAYLLNRLSDRLKPQRAATLSGAGLVE